MSWAAMIHGRPARVVRRSERFFRYECGVRGRTVSQNESGGAAALRCGSPCKNLSLCLRPAVPLFGYLHAVYIESYRALVGARYPVVHVVGQVEIETVEGIAVGLFGNRDRTRDEL